MTSIGSRATTPHPSLEERWAHIDPLTRRERMTRAKPGLAPVVDPYERGAYQAWQMPFAPGSLDRVEELAPPSSPRCSWRKK